MATTKVNPTTVYVISAKGIAAAAKAQAAIAALGDAAHSNNRKLLAMQAAAGTAGATGAVLKAACNAAGDGLFAGHAIGRNGWFVPAPQPAKPAAAPAKPTAK
jgi:hypothetical protein